MVTKPMPIARYGKEDIMRIELLRRFIVIAEELNLTTAAAKLFVAQPLLSKQLKQLEEEYGTKLINRTTTSMTLTPEGEVLYERAKLICEIDSQTRNDLSINRRRGNRVLRLALPPFVATSFFGGKGKEFLDKYPFLRLNVLEGGAFNTVQHLKIGVADVVVTHTSESFLGEVESFYSRKVSFILAYSKEEFPEFCGREVVSTRDLVDVPLYVCSRFASLLHASELSRNLHFNITCTTNVLLTGVKLVENGYAVGLFPSYVYPQLKEKSDLGLCFIDDEHLSIEMHVLMASSKEPDDMLMDLIYTLSESLDELIDREEADDDA